MNNAINTLFKRKKNPFCLKKINFTPTMSSNCHTNNKILIQSQEIKPLYIFTNTKKQKLHEYKKWSAEQCVNSISRWLYDNKNNLIIMKNILRPIKANDITILVNNKYEAEIIKKKLRKLNIQSIFYSKKKNIYKTEEAKEILYIFRAILNLENKKKFHAAIATNIITKNFEKLYNFNQTEKILKKFNKYKILWQKIGIFAVLWNIIKDFNTYNKKKYSSDINKINNLLYIGQLIEKKSKYIFDKYELIAWFKNKIFEKNNIKNKKKYIINDNYINISTIHMSKGSEYLITWIPFAMNYNKTWTKNNKLITNNKNIEKKTKKKQIAENLRLLYVALTRSILHCSISIAPIIQSKHKYKKNRILESHKSALGYLIQKKKDDTIAEFKKNIKKLSNDPYIHVHKNKIEPKKILQTYYKIKKYSYIKEKKKKNYINVLSYSKLCVKNKVIKKKYKNEIIIKKNNHTFPKGKNSGLMLHKILKKITFNKKIDTIIIKKEMKKYNIDKHWFKNLKKWIKYIVNYPLNEENFSLTQLKKNDYIKEMEFYIPIKNKLKCEIINKIIQKFDKFSKKSETMNFKKTKGLLIGYIDLIFKFKNKYYILDYKSNWLGSEDCHYKKKNIYKKIIQYRYDIQYQIYSIALHRYLKNKIQKYSFEKHFGGIYFLFIRAVNKKKKKNAIFYTLPKKKLIQKLNNLF
ncbi:3'-5' exonuclease [Buchnera aphidicola (Mollitrichosiphum nigrofasciatum)]|uniref:3'-5' exonuclease n=1 Tax=Buchnera aphidicola TaxID=9 RepID=UPI0031B88976